MDERAQSSLDALFDSFLFAIVFLVIGIIFFAVAPSFTNVIANLVLSSTNIQQPGIIILLWELLPLLFVALGIVLFIKTAMQRQSKPTQFGGI